jgi:hypothetical protein
MLSFKAKIEIIGINPFVFVPENILDKIFKQSGRNKGNIPVCGKINGKNFTQTLLRYKGEWRLYINTVMLPESPKRIDEIITVTIQFDPKERTITPHPKLVKAFKANRIAKKIFDNLIPSRKKEIVRYISSLKTDKSIEANIEKAISHLLGKGNFVGRDNPE